MDPRRRVDLICKQLFCLCPAECVGNTRQLSCYYTWTLCKRDRTSRSDANEDVKVASSDPPNALTKFICKVEARVFADMQSAPPQEMNEGYGLPAEGRPDIPNA